MDLDLYLNPRIHNFRVMMVGDIIGRFSNLRCAQNTAFWLSGMLSGTKYAGVGASEVNIDEMWREMIIHRYGMHNSQVLGIRKKRHA